MFSDPDSLVAEGIRRGWSRYVNWLPTDLGQTPPPGMARMHELMVTGNPGMHRMHELSLEGNPGMQRMHELMR